MTVSELAERFGFQIIAAPEPGREIEGGYVGDLLSWVMGRAQSGNVWITIMSNVNVLAVASLSDVSAVLLAEGVALEPGHVQTALEKGVNVLSTDLSAFEAAVRIAEAVRPAS